MANYDTPGLVYDGLARFDEPEQPQLNIKHMAKPKLSLNKITPDELLALANQIKTALTGNANFTSPNPTLAVLTGAITLATSKVAGQKAAQLTASQATDDRDAALQALKALLAQLSLYVENTSGGDAVKIQSAGMALKAPATAQAVPDQVLNLTVSVGDNDGELDAQWDPVRSAKSYQVQISADPITSTSWHDATPSSVSKTVIENLTSGTRMWVRVRAINKKGPGPWSDPATKIVP